MADSKTDLRDDDTNDADLSDEEVDCQYHASSDDDDSDNDIEDSHGDDNAAAYDDGIDSDTESSMVDVNGNNQYVIVNLECATVTDSNDDEFDDLDSTTEALENEDTAWARSEENFNIHSNTRSVDGSEMWMISDDSEVLSRYGTMYQLCRHCTYNNSMHDYYCQVCETVMVANPCPNGDAYMANQILQKDHSSMFFQQMQSDKSQRKMVRKQAKFHQTVSLLTDSIDNQAMRLLQNVQNFLITTGTISNYLTSKLLSKPELHSLAATFIEHYLSYCSIFANQNFDITLYYHATTTTMSSHNLLSSTDQDNAEHVAIQSIMQECRAPSKTMLLSKELETFVDACNRNDGDGNTVALDESSATHDDISSEHCGSSFLGVDDHNWMKKDDDDDISSGKTTSFRHLFVVATISVCSSHSDLMDDFPDNIPFFVKQNDTTVCRSHDNPIPVLPLMFCDISQPVNIIMDSHTRTFDYNGNRILTNAEFMENHGFLYRGLDYVCSNFFARYSGN